QHFGKPLDLIYCEALADGENAILVVVRGGSVYLDAELPILNLADEFISLISGENKYQIYVYGDVPLAEFATDEKFAFDEELVESFMILEEPVFPTLPVDEAYLLLPIDEALAGFKPPTSKATKLVIAMVIIGVLAYGGWKLLAPKPKPVITETVTTPSIFQQPTVNNTNPYAAYQAILSTPAPSDIVIAAVQDVQLLLTIPGWAPTSMTYDNKIGNLSFDIQAAGGDLGLLLAWTQHNQVELQGATGRAVLVFPLNLANRPTPTVMYNLRDTVASLYDILKRIIPDTAPNLGITQSQGNFRATSLTISFSGIAPNTLILLAKELQTYPVVLQTFTMSIDDGILSGSMQLQILGV
ncbi:MAG: hypothetical protein ACK4PR_09590, partial [Gammaproteobacteria bacterium]